MAVISLRRAADRNAVQTLVKWRASVMAAASPDNQKQTEPATVRQWADELGLEYGLDAWESDVAAVEKVERLSIAVRMLDEEIERTLKPYKTREALAAAIAKAEEDLAKLRAVEGELFGLDCTRGHERAAAARARLEAERIYGQ